MGYSIADLLNFAHKAGFTGTDAEKAAAIAEAESGGNQYAYNPESAAGTPKGSGSRGLWQIYGNAHPEYNNDSSYDPQTNANEAYKIFQEAGNSFRPWSTYTNGAYQQFLSAAQSADGSQSTANNNHLNTTTLLANPLDPSSWFTPVQDWFSNHITRTILVILGLILIAVGIGITFKNDGTAVIKMAGEAIKPAAETGA